MLYTENTEYTEIDDKVDECFVKGMMSKKEIRRGRGGLLISLHGGAQGQLSTTIIILALLLVAYAELYRHLGAFIGLLFIL